MLDTVAPARFFPRVLSFSAVIIIPPTLHIHLRVNIALDSDISTRRVGNLLKNIGHLGIGEHWGEGGGGGGRYFTFLSLKV